MYRCINGVKKGKRELCKKQYVDSMYRVQMNWIIGYKIKIKGKCL
jgi:hypothetical protein